MGVLANLGRALLEAAVFAAVTAAVTKLVEKALEPKDSVDESEETPDDRS